VAGGDLPVEGLASLLDLLSQRHVLPLVWDLRGGPQPFGVLSAGISASSAQVSQRLHALRDAGIVEIDEAGDYRLSAVGRRLQGVLEPVATFAQRDWGRLTPRQRSPRGAATRGRGEPDEWD
jgi:DNA-binding HxlR family transcriptional regulator